MALPIPAPHNLSAAGNTFVATTALSADVSTTYDAEDVRTHDDVSAYDASADGKAAVLVTLLRTAVSASVKLAMTPMAPRLVTPHLLTPRGTPPPHTPWHPTSMTWQVKLAMTAALQLPLSGMPHLLTLRGTPPSHPI
jgi:hypothetical protein